MWKSYFAYFYALWWSTFCNAKIFCQAIWKRWSKHGQDNVFALYAYFKNWKKINFRWLLVTPVTFGNLVAREYVYISAGDNTKGSNLPLTMRRNRPQPRGGYVCWDVIKVAPLLRQIISYFDFARLKARRPCLLCLFRSSRWPAWILKLTNHKGWRCLRAKNAFQPSGPSH